MSEWTEQELNHVDRVRARFHRKTIAREGICHHGDCLIGSIRPICTCGLLHDLIRYPRVALEIYPDFDVDLAKQDTTFYWMREIQNGPSA